MKVHKPVEVLCAQLPQGLTDREVPDGYLQLVLVGCPHELVRLEQPLRFSQKRLIQDWENDAGVLRHPESQLSTPLLQVREIDIEVLLVLLCHLPQEIGVLRLGLAVQRELEQELLEVPPDFCIEALVDILHNLTELLLVQVIEGLGHVLITHAWLVLRRGVLARRVLCRPILRLPRAVALRAAHRPGLTRLQVAGEGAQREARGAGVPPGWGVRGA
mmetsp:Transcript_31522/g.90461  ORF Transcript_31522/g.90461 Transcript_31522/m.90461 type:complete len:217 (-) Transcript_31522:368-1018(-)